MGDELAELLELEEIDRDLYRASFAFADPFNLYGGQVAAQALRAAGLSVGPDRLPHSLHGYFLRAGDASRPTVFQVFRDRDGRSFSARRVVALQGGEVIFNMSVDAEDWLLTDLTPHTAAGGRGWYTGAIFDRHGSLVASTAQEALFRRRRVSRRNESVQADDLI